MTIFQFVRSRGYKPTPIGNWIMPGSSQFNNTLTLDQALEQIIKEDTPSQDPRGPRK